MEIVDKVKQVLTEEEDDRTRNSNFQKLRDFYETMKKAGVAINQGYKLPPIDTIGRRSHSGTTNGIGRKK